MLLEFSLSNYRSFNETQTLNFRATGLTSDDPDVDARNLLEADGSKLLKIVGIYGANASGKSNLIAGLRLFKDMVTRSLSNENMGLMSYNPFRQGAELKDNAGFFQIVLILEGKKFRYGFTLDDDGSVLKEWLYGPAEKNNIYFFKRDKSDVFVNEERFKEGSNLPYEKLRSDTLFLTFCASYDGETSRAIRNYLGDKVLIDRNPSTPYGGMRANTVRRSQTDNLIKEGKKDIVLSWLKEAGLYFSDIELKDVDYGQRVSVTNVQLYKNIFNFDGKVTGRVPMDLDSDESQGTQKFYRYIGGIYPLFNNGGIYISDEIDSNFHPFLLQKLVKLFQNSNINKAGAQLLFTSHDTNLMHPENMRRDQFYFTEKTMKDETQLYSMANLKGIRNNADFARQYLSGFYGALPRLGNYLEMEEL